jgi:hypothetical protein
MNVDEVDKEFSREYSSVGIRKQSISLSSIDKS